MACGRRVPNLTQRKGLDGEQQFYAQWTWPFPFVRGSHNVMASSKDDTVRVNVRVKAAGAELCAMIEWDN